jgi:hypothetical protein
MNEITLDQVIEREKLNEYQAKRLRGMCLADLLDGPLVVDKLGDCVHVADDWRLAKAIEYIRASTPNKGAQ